MKRKRLAYELANFCLAYKILNVECRTTELRERMETQLDDVVFVETLINQIFKKMRNHQDIDTGKLIELLSALERLRLEHEYSVPERTKAR